MRKILNHWEQVIDKRIEKIDNRTTTGSLTFLFEGGSQLTIEPVTSAPYGLAIFQDGVDPANPETVSLGLLTGRTIKAVLVPCSSPPFREESNLTLVFEDRSRVIIAADDRYSPIRIT